MHRLVFLPLLLTALLFVGWRSASSAATEPTTTAPLPDGYVADAECAKCHRDLAESFRQVGMGRSFGRPDPRDGVEDFSAPPLFHAPSQRWYHMTLRDGRPVFRRWQVDGEGRPINEVEQPVEWVLGSGHRARSYLYTNPAGELLLLPIDWYSGAGLPSSGEVGPGSAAGPEVGARTQAGGRSRGDGSGGGDGPTPGARPATGAAAGTRARGHWGMAPGFDRADHAGVARPVQRECLFCHNAYPAAPAGTPAGHDLHGQPDVFPAELPHGIGCQRCHGPGERHVDLAAGGLGSTAQVREAIVNPGRLEPVLRDDVCWQCHMQPSVTIPGMRRLGRGDGSYRPGEPLPDFNVLLDVVETARARDGERFEIYHHAYRLVQSPCWQESARRLSCLTCHDPHRKVPPAERLDHYRAACLSCHAAGGPAGGRGAAEGGARSDGRRTGGSRGNAGVGGEAAAGGEAAVGGHAAVGQNAAADGEAAAGGAVAARRGACGRPRPPAPPLAAWGPTELRAHATGDCVTCHMPARRTQDVVHAVMTDHLIQRRPAPEAERLAPLEERDPVLLDVRPLELVEEPASPRGAAAPVPSGGGTASRRGPEGDLLELYRALAVTRVAGAASPDALDHLERMLDRLRPDPPDGWLDLGRGLIGRGELERAETALRAALERAPENPEALQLLGAVRLGRRAPAEARELLRRALAAGASPEALYNLALAELSLGRPEAAREALERAVFLSPTFSSAWVGLGRLRERLDGGDGAAAAEAYRRALAVRPERTDAYLALGRLLVERGLRAEALRWLRHGARVAAQPEAVAALLAEVEDGGGTPPSAPGSRR